MCELYVGRPHNDKNAKGTDAYCTVFVGRLNYETTEETLRKAFDGIVGEV